MDFGLQLFKNILLGCFFLLQNGVFHSQEKVLHCLQDHLDEDGGLQPECVIQIIRLAEFSADDYHMDKYLYIRCKNDRETFCADVSSFKA